MLSFTQAPECSQLVRKNPTLATDVWSFGAMLLELICGAQEVKSVEAAVAALQSKAVTVDGLPVHADVVKALASCLIADPTKRATAAELCALLGCKHDDTSSPAHAATATIVKAVTFASFAG